MIYFIYLFNKSKALNRLSSMLPDGSASWYKADFSYYGSDDQNLNKSMDLEDRVKKPFNSLNNYKNDYIRNFDEMNKGLVDSYSISKGGALLQIRKEMENSN